MTPQEIFDTVALHLLQQGHAAVNHHGSCTYRAPNGDKCAFGILIPDDVYDPKMEGKRASAVIAANLDTLGHFAPHVLLINALQSLHDTQLRYHGLDKWKSEMIRIAATHDLTTEVLQ